MAEVLPVDLADVALIRRAATAMVSDPSPTVQRVGVWLFDAAAGEYDYLSTNEPEHRADPLPGDEIHHAREIASTYLAERMLQ